MGSLYRSETMCLVNIYLQSEAAFTCISELGERGLVQFSDLNPSVNGFQRKFVNEVRRCDDMERILRFFEKEMKKDNLACDDDGSNPPALDMKEMNDLEAKLEKFESEMREVNKNHKALKQNFLELNELKYILRKAQIFFDEATTNMQETSDQHEFGGVEDGTSSLLGNDFSTSVNAFQLSFLSGVISRDRINSFERFLWRACRGNVFLRHAEIEQDFDDPNTGDKTKKNVFIIFFQGGQLQNRVKSICEGFNAKLYPIHDNAPQRRETAIGVMTRLEDLQTVLSRTEDHRRMILAQVSSTIRRWFIMVRKMKAIYHTLNLFNVNMADKCLIGEGWCAVKHLDSVREALRIATETSGSTVPSILQERKTKEMPPTFNETNPFTQSFQMIIDAYGVATYREINPTPFTIITFPFLFAVMFGDFGHGIIMMLLGAYLVYNERKFMREKSKNNEIWDMTFGGRYMILLMGIFSTYTGFLYNECFSRSFNAFGSAWNVSAIPKEFDLKTMSHVELDPYSHPGVYRSVGVYPQDAGTPYLYGMDPIWQSAENKITFQNSYKMKSSIVFGMCQMLFGLLLAFKNHRFFKDRLSLYCEWVPQMIFIMCVVGYLCFLIILKWLTIRNPAEAPSLLIGLINMFMFSPSPDGLLLFNGQEQFQHFIVILALICIPWMLLARPYILYKRHHQRRQLIIRVDAGGTSYGERTSMHREPCSESDMSLRRRILGGGEYHAVDVDDDTAVNLLGHDQISVTSSDSCDSATMDKQEFDLMEIMIYQIIHTIEYCLNCISHTASYLRLWALSLAHAELSEVLWKMVMSIGLGARPGFFGGFMTYAIFSFFASLTIAILLGMEGLSAFLHALRLHWVEFQSKFYKGQGEPFEPFSFEVILNAAEND